ncbi:hypothetical protein V8F20_006444 [Naviculisporaceae sp. PSN 640]
MNNLASIFFFFFFRGVLNSVFTINDRVLDSGTDGVNRASSGGQNRAEPARLQVLRCLLCNGRSFTCQSVLGATLIHQTRHKPHTISW